VINIPVISVNIQIVILNAIYNVCMLQCRVELKPVESDLIIFKSDPKPVESGRRCNPTDLKISRMTSAL